MKMISNVNQRSLNQGFSLIEALAALVITMVTLAAIGPLFAQQKQSNVRAKQVGLANSLAQRTLEQYRYLTRGDVIPPALAESVQSVDGSTGVNFGLTIRIRGLHGVNSNGEPDCRASVPSSGDTTRCVRVTVRAFDNNTNSPVLYETESVFARIRTPGTPGT
jgi:type II secretory pathway pseudopilin PulG